MRRYLDLPLAELLAAEYVLGTLQGRARQRFEKLILAHPSLHEQVRTWEVRLNRLAESIPPVTPPAATWNALERRLFAPAPRARLTLWRGLAISSGLLAGVLAILLWINPAQAPAYLVLINDTTSHQPMWVVSTASDMEQFYVKSMKPMDMPENSRCLLWLRPENSQRYYALGVLPDKGDEKRLAIGQDLRPMLPGQLLVTIEDMSGPMPVQPSGPARYHGEWMPLKSG